MIDDIRRQAASNIIVGLPVFGAWVAAISEYDTPFGRIGYRQLELLWLMRHDMLPARAVTASSIANHFAVQPSVVTRLLAKLEANELIERVAVVGDRRSSEIRIMPRGVELSKFVEEIYFEEVLSVLHPYDDVDIEGMHRYAAMLHQVGVTLLDGRKSRIVQQNQAHSSSSEDTVSKDGWDTESSSAPQPTDTCE